MKYQGKKVAVLGAGLSGTAAALLLRSEGADVTVLDSAERNDFAQIDHGKSAGAGGEGALRPREPNRIPPRTILSF